MSEVLTKEMINKCVVLLKQQNVTGDFILRIHPDWLEVAFELGYEPFCPLDERTFIEAMI